VLYNLPIGYAEEIIKGAVHTIEESLTHTEQEISLCKYVMHSIVLYHALTVRIGL